MSVKTCAKGPFSVPDCSSHLGFSIGPQRPVLRDIQVKRLFSSFIARLAIPMPEASGLTMLVSALLNIKVHTCRGG
jgi:hypothetical protein